MADVTERLHQAFDRQRRVTQAPSTLDDTRTLPTNAEPHHHNRNVRYTYDEDSEDGYDHGAIDTTTDRNNDRFDVGANVATHAHAHHQPPPPSTWHKICNGGQTRITTWILLTVSGVIMVATLVAMALAVRKFTYVRRSNVSLMKKLTWMQAQASLPISQTGVTTTVDDPIAHHQVIAKFFENVHGDTDSVGDDDIVKHNATLGPNLLLPTLPSIPASVVVDFVMVKGAEIASDLAHVSLMVNGASSDTPPPTIPQNNDKDGAHVPSPLTLLQISDMQTRLKSCEHLVDLIEALLPRSLVVKYCNLETADVRSAIANQRAHLQKICRQSLSNAS